jgi:hypothetical protein
MESVGLVGLNLSKIIEAESVSGRIWKFTRVMLSQCITWVTSSSYRFDELFLGHHSFITNIKELNVGTGLILLNFDDERFG